jgi:hypothetical protein
MACPIARAASGLSGIISRVWLAVAKGGSTFDNCFAALREKFQNALPLLPAHGHNAQDAFYEAAARLNIIPVAGLDPLDIHERPHGRFQCQYIPERPRRLSAGAARNRVIRGKKQSLLTLVAWLAAPLAS